MHFKNREDLKNHVERLKAFYNEFYSFLIVIAFSLLIWLLAGGGYFWPVWIMVLWGGPLFFKASKLEILDCSYYKLICSLRDQLPFLKKSWEHEKLAELQKSLNGSKKPVVKEAPTKKAAIKKTVTTNPTAVKTVTQKAPAKKKSPAKSATKKAPTKKGPTKKAPAKKSPIKKGTPKKV